MDFKKFLPFGLAILLVLGSLGLLRFVSEDSVPTTEVGPAMPLAEYPSESGTASSVADSVPLYEYRDRDGKSVRVNHVLGQEPFTGLVRMRADGEMVQLDDDTVYRNLQWAVDQMGSPHKEQWQYYLNQTALLPHDPKRYFYIHGLEIEERDADSMTVCSFQALEGGAVAIYIKPDLLLDPDWTAIDPVLQVMLISGMVHEMRHLEDFLERFDLFHSANTEMLAPSRDRSRKSEFTEDDFVLIMAASAETVASEMVAFNRQYAWIKKHHPEVVATGILPNPEEGPTWKAWESGDTELFARAVYDRYESIIWSNVPLSEVESFKTSENVEGIIEVALIAYSKAEPDPVE